MEEKIIIQKRPPKSPVAAGILAGFFPFGVGAMYNGLYFKGLIYLIIFAGLVTLQGHEKGQPFLGLLLCGFWIYQIIESVQTAKAINNRAAGGEEAGPPPLEEQVLEPVKSGSVFWGIFLIVLGVVFLMANFDLIDYKILFDLWPVAVIGIGIKLVIDFFARSRKGA